MKIIYCCSSDDIKELKLMPCDYTSSKISTLFTKTEPFFIKEFLSISNIKYIKVKDYPDYKVLWDDMMSKITFAYNFRHLESKVLFSEYVEFNRKYADEINAICESDDLVVVNDSSLYLLPEMVNCKVAIRNIQFDDCFIERVPYHRELVATLFKAEKFFVSRRSLASFHRFLDTSYVFDEADRGGCHYMRRHVDKEAVLDVLKICRAYMDSFSTGDTLKYNDLLEYIRTLTIPKENEAILTNVPLLHLEAYIKKHPKINIRYIRASVEVDEKQDRMVQYLKKVYNCRIDVIDKHDLNVLILEMLYCGIFIGSEHTEIAKLLRKPCLPDDPDPHFLSGQIEGQIGKIQKKIYVSGEDEYLQEFLEIHGYDVETQIDCTIDDRIDTYLLELIDWMSSQVRGVSELMPTEVIKSESSTCEAEPGYADKHSARSGSLLCNERDDIIDDSGQVNHDDVLYEKTVNDEKILYKKRASRKTVSRVLLKNVVHDEEENRKDGHPNNQHRKECTANFCRCPDKNINYRRRKPVQDPKPVEVDRIKEMWSGSNKIALFDYDGTLANIEELPHMAAPKEELFELLDKFSEEARLIICTGRSVEVVDSWFPKRYEIYAEHGAAHRLDGEWTYKEKIPYIEECIDMMEYYQVRTPGSIVERKSHGAAFHYKKVKDFDIEKLYFLLKRIVGGAVVCGKGVIEVRSGNKYEIAKEIGPAIVAGDDKVDEDLYDACDGITIRVGEGPTRAEYCAASVAEFLGLLSNLSK